MDFSQAKLDSIEEMAYKLIPISIMAVMLEFSEIELRMELSNIYSPVYRSFYRGYGRQLVETREIIIQSAKNGSTPALEQMLLCLQHFQNDMPHE